jgi:hypothetical protein
MKKTLATLTIASLAALALTGCNSGGSYSSSVARLISKKEKTSSETRVTTYKYDSFAALISEKQTLDNTQVYEIKDYSIAGNTYTRYKTLDNGSRQKLVSTLISVGNAYKDSEFAVYNEVEGVFGSTPVEKSTFEYDEYGYTSNAKYYVNGELVRELKNYDYLSDNGYTYTEWKTGDAESEGTVMRFMVTKSVSNAITEYKILSGWDGSTGKLIEERADYESGEDWATYTVTTHDPDGVAASVETEVTEQYEFIPISINY